MSKFFLIPYLCVCVVYIKCPVPAGFFFAYQPAVSKPHSIKQAMIFLQNSNIHKSPERQQTFTSSAKNSSYKNFDIFAFKDTTQLMILKIFDKQSKL